MVHRSDMRVARLSVTPVKGLAVQHPSSVEVTSDGVAGDRALFLIDEKGTLISCTELGGLLSHRAHFDARSGVLEVTDAGGVTRVGPTDPGEAVETDFYGERSVAGHVVPGWGDYFSDIAGRPVRLVRGDRSGYDIARLTLLGSASVEALAGANGVDHVDSRRFRMNVELSGTAPHEEDTWDGQKVRLGEVELVVGGPVKRCAATTRNPDSGVVDLQTLRMIGQSRGRQDTARFGKGFYFGVYAEVLEPGRVRVGDTVELVG